MRRIPTQGKPIKSFNDREEVIHVGERYIVTKGAGLLRIYTTGSRYVAESHKRQACRSELPIFDIKNGQTKRRDTYVSEHSAELVLSIGNYLSRVNPHTKRISPFLSINPDAVEIIHSPTHGYLANCYTNLNVMTHKKTLNYASMRVPIIRQIVASPLNDNVYLLGSISNTVSIYMINPRSWECNFTNSDLAIKLGFPMSIPGNPQLHLSIRPNTSDTLITTGGRHLHIMDLWHSSRAWPITTREIREIYVPHVYLGTNVLVGTYSTQVHLFDLRFGQLNSILCDKRMIEIWNVNGTLFTTDEYANIYEFV